MVTETKTNLAAKYKAKGAQQATLQEYMARQQKAQKKQFKLPKAIQYILLAPVLIIFCFGLFFIPYMIFKAMTSSGSSSSATSSARN